MYLFVIYRPCVVANSGVWERQMGVVVLGGHMKRVELCSFVEYFLVNFVASTAGWLHDLLGLLREQGERKKSRSPVFLIN